MLTHQRGHFSLAPYNLDNLDVLDRHTTETPPNVREPALSLAAPPQWAAVAAAVATEDASRRPMHDAPSLAVAVAAASGGRQHAARAAVPHSKSASPCSAASTAANERVTWLPAGP